MTVYLDVIFFENLIMNLAIILSEAVVLKSCKKLIRKIIAGLVASMYYVFTLLYTELSLFQIPIGLIIIKIAFNPKNMKTLIKETILFYFISFIFGGLSFAAVNLFNNGNITILNGVLIGKFGISKILLCSIIGAFLVTKFLRKKKKHIFREIAIGLGGKEVIVRVLLDTGNLLKEPYTGKPVIIVEKDALNGLLDEEFLNKKMMIIPYKSVGNENGTLLGFVPDYVIIKQDEEKLIENVVIGIYNEHLSNGKIYSGIFGLEILNEGILEI